MKVALTGATGFVGNAVLKSLLRSGHHVLAVVRARRHNRPTSLPSDPRIEPRSGDVLDPGSLAAAFRGADAVVHLVGIIAECGRATFDNIHVRGTRAALDAAKHCGIQRWIQMSALGTRPAAQSRYHQTKWAAEQLVLASGLGYTIFRPSVIYGPQDQFLNLFDRISRWSPIVPIMGHGRNLLQPVPVDAVAHVFAAALETPQALGGTFDLCGLERLSFTGVIRALLRAKRRRRVLLHVPMPAARGLAAVLERLYPWLLRRPPPLNREQLLMLEEDNIGDPLPACRLFNLRIPPLREALTRVP
jgi:NADH dehydrogenase